MNISAVLLAGGESRRMGKDKAKIVFRGKPLWERQIDTLRQLEPAEIFVSAKEDPPWRPNDIVFVPDDGPSRGPLSGLAATLSRVRTSHMLVLAVDMPFMAKSFFDSLVIKITETRGIVPRIGDRLEPLAAIYPREAHVDLAEALAGNDFSLQSVTKKLIEREKLLAFDVHAGEQQLFQNLNEPADLLR